MTSVEIVGVGYTEAFELLRDANQYAAGHHTRLTGELDGTGGMAGDSAFAASWAASYDRTAALVVTGCEDVVTALGAVARLCASSLDNHVQAELASAALDPGQWPGLLTEHPYDVTAYVPPGSLGGDPSSLPGWANVILDHVEGFVWPDADLDRLHAAATTWTALADHLADLAGLVARAGEELWGERSPEIPLAIDALTRLRTAIADLGVEAAYLARACTAHAAAVQSHRDAVLDLVGDLLRDAIVIQAAGFALGLVTAGTANAGAASINVAKVAAEGPRFLALLDRLRDLAYTASLGLNAGATTVTSVRTRLGPFVGARLVQGTYRDGGAVLRVRAVISDPRSFQPVLLRGMSSKEIRQLVPNWTMRAAKSGGGLIFHDPLNRGRQIRLMRGYPGNRPDPVTHGPYAVVSQNGAAVKVPLEGNPTL